MDRIFVGHIVPLMEEEGKRVWVSSWNPRELEIRFTEYIQKLGNWLKNFEFNRDVKSLETLANAIVAFYKLPLLATLLPPGVELSETPFLPQELYWLWIFTKEIELWKAKLIELPMGKFRKAMKGRRELKCLEELLIDSKLKELAYEIFTRVPSDTRPGCNTSKLIPHLLATSAIAASVYLSKTLRAGAVDLEQQFLELNLLRIASLLHDIGKPQAWRECIENRSWGPHAPQSENLVRKLLSGIGLPEDFINVIAVLVKYHHDPEKIPREYYELNINGRILRVRIKFLSEILMHSDRVSSAIDRLLKRSMEILSAEPDIEKRIGKEEFSSGNYWLRQPNETVEDFTARISKRIFEETRVGEESKPILVAGEAIYVISIDVRRIKEFISREALRVVIATSYLVDAFITYSIPRVLNAYLKLPPENVIYAGGGFTIAIGHGKLDEKELLRRANNVLGVELMATLAYTPLREDWQYTMELLSAELTRRKCTLTDSDSLILLGIEELCEMCNRRPAEKEIRRPEGVESVCSECYKLWEFAGDIYIRGKLEALKINLNWEDLKEYLIEWLSGSERFKEKGYNIAIVEADGNMMGEFTGTSVSLTDAIERSIRIDYALKKGLLEVMEELTSIEEGGRIIARVFTGLTYAGGDDMLAIWPAWLAIPISLYIAYWFWRLMGGVRQLSVGIASGKVKHNIWALKETAHELLKLCKSRFRLELTSSGDTSKMYDTILVLSFLYSDSQVLLPAHIGMYKEYEAQGILHQPYALSMGNIQYSKLGDLRNLLRIIVGDTSDKSISEYIGEVLRVFYKNFTGEVIKAKRVRDIVREVYTISRTMNPEGRYMSSFTIISTIYTIRQKCSIEKDERKDIYDWIAKTQLSYKLQKPAPLLDAYLLAKFALGGR